MSVEGFLVPDNLRMNYLNRKKSEIKNYLSLIGAQDTTLIQEKIKYFKHQIKGNATSFGFEELSSLADEIKLDPAKALDLKEAESTLIKMRNYVEKQLEILM